MDTAPLDKQKLANRYYGVVLAAGFGTRLLPLTAHLPKPLLPFSGVPTLYINLLQLERLGLQHVMVNAHHLPHLLAKAVASYPGSLQLSVSLEQEILGTGGAFARMHPWRRHHKPLLAISGDIVSNFPLDQLLARHEATAAVASLALLPAPLPGENCIWSDGLRVLGIGGPRPQEGATPHGFANAQVLSDGFLARITEPRHESIITYYREALARGETIAALIAPCFWHDLGTPARLLQAQKEHLDLLCEQGQDPLELATLWDKLFPSRPIAYSGKNAKANIIPPVLLSQEIRLEPEAQLGPYVVALGHGHMAAKSKLSYSLLYGHRRLPAEDCHHRLQYEDLELNLGEKSI